MWQNLGERLLGSPILLLLMLLSWAVLAVAIERFWTLALERRRLRRARTVLLDLLGSGQRAAAKAAIGSLPAHLGTGVLGAAMEATPAQPRRSQRLRAQAARQVQARLWWLASVGALAPFVGLLGTVLGIMEAFGRMATESAGGFAVVSGGLSEALITTAAGIFLAIEAVFAFNLLKVLSSHYAWELREAAEDVAAASGGQDGGHARP